MLNLQTISQDSLLERKGVRREHKFLMHRETFTPFITDLKPFVLQDVHSQKGTNCYKVSSVYFENYELRNYFDKVSGLNKRLKTRLRFYPSDSNSIYNLEFKYKNDGFYIKHKDKVPKSVVNKLLKEDYLKLFNDNNQIVADFAKHAHTNNLKPFVKIDYLRHAFLGKHDPATRITIDRQVKCCRYREGYMALSAHIPSLPNNLFVLEVKIGDYYPFWLVSLLKKYSFKKTAVSKYVYSVQAMARNSTLSL